MLAQVCCILSHQENWRGLHQRTERSAISYCWSRVHFGFGVGTLALMCQFHQMLIVRRYLTQDPDLEASQELLNLINIITRTDKESFIGAFDDWYEKYKDVINERVHDKRIKRVTPPYMRPRLRSAYLSIRRNMPLLWTFYDHPETGLPNTNNGLEGLFSDLKTKVRIHSGISKENRKKLLDEYIKRHY